MKNTTKSQLENIFSVEDIILSLNVKLKLFFQKFISKFIN